MAVFSVVLYSSSQDRFFEAVSFAAGARAQGKTVLFFLRGPALKSFVLGHWEKPADASVAKGLADYHGPSPASLLGEIRAGGKVRLYACSAWVRLLNLESGPVAAKVDAVVGLNAFLSQAEGGPILYI